jgi:hypothetical protein
MRSTSTALAGENLDMRDPEIQAALDRHWAASDANDFGAEYFGDPFEPGPLRAEWVKRMS